MIFSRKFHGKILFIYEKSIAFFYNVAILIFRIQMKGFFMKTRSLFGKKYIDLQIRELEIPALMPDQVLVKVHACGVCGTDLNFVRDWSGDYQGLGHEIAGEIIDTGSIVSTLKKGDKVVVEDCTMCGKCADCKAGHPEFCRNMYNMNGFPGMGEYIVVNAAACTVFDGLDYIHAALTEPLAVAYNAVLTADIPLGGSVVVLGPGAIGLLCAKVARLRGAGYVAVVGRNDSTPEQQARLELAVKLGCDQVIVSARESVRDTVLKRFPQGVDRVIVTSPPKSMYDAFDIIRYGGGIIYLGLSFKEGENIIDFDVNRAIFNKITLKPSFAEPAINFPAALDLIKNGLIPAELFQTHTCSFDDCHELFEATLKGTVPVIKPVFCP